MASYYSVEAILTDSQKAPCTFELSVPQLAPLNNGTAIDAGTKLELPLWLAEMLAVSEPAGPAAGSLASLDMPAALGRKVINALRADPKSVDIREQAQWFYGVGERMLELFDDEDLAEILLDTFKQRALEIADRAQKTRGGDRNFFTNSWDDSERRLFRAANEGRDSVKKWMEAQKQV